MDAIEDFYSHELFNLLTARALPASKAVITPIRVINELYAAVVPTALAHLLNFSASNRMTSPIGAFELGPAWEARDNVFEQAMTDPPRLQAVFCSAVPIGTSSQGDTYLVALGAERHNEVFRIDHDVGEAHEVADSLQAFFFLNVTLELSQGKAPERTLRQRLSLLEGRVRLDDDFESLRTDGFANFSSRLSLRVDLSRAQWVIDRLLGSKDPFNILKTDPGIQSQAPEGERAAERLYALWAAFFHHQDERLEELLAIADSHQARLVRDAARLISQSLNGELDRPLLRRP